jgi:hypothetical protein
VWPPYVAGAVAKGVLTPRQARQLRASYGAKLSMIDCWLGRVLDAMDRRDLWSDTAFFLLTDHGHYLGEKDVFGKPGVPVYETLGHIPLLVSWPGVGPGARSALTTSVDVHATLLDLFGVATRQRTHGRSLVPLLEGSAAGVRDVALAGVWGRQVHLVASGAAADGPDGCFKYVRGPVGRNEPLVMLSNRWSTMPVHRLPDLRLPPPDARATLGRMPGSSVPVLRQPFAAGDLQPYWAGAVPPGNLLFDLANDPDEERDRCGEVLEKRAEELLRAALVELEAPPEQLVRLGLA